MTALAIAAGLAVLGVAGVALRSPVLRRMALRNAVRRRGETLLVVLGAMLGTAIITGSLLVGDTLDASIRASAPNQLGPTDLTVRPATPDAATAVADTLEDFSSADVDGMLELTVLDASVATLGEGTDRRAAPNAQLLETDFDAAEDFGGDPSATGISGSTPDGNRTVIGQDLADELGVGIGDQVEAYAYGTTVRLTVDGILPRTGIAGFWTGFQSRSLNAFVAPGTIADLYGAAAPELAAAAEPPASLTLVSATGDVFTGADRSDVVEQELSAALGRIPGVEVDPVKRDLLDAAEEQGDTFSELFLAIGSFAVLAGVLLLVNIFVMLAEERKAELGMLRAVGLRRRGLVGALVVEGGLYSVASALLGAVAGIGVGRAIVYVTGRIFASFGDLSLRFTPEPESVVTGLLVGLLIALLTVLATSVRISRINIIRAIRDLPEPVRIARKWWVTVLAALLGAGGAALAVLAIAEREPYGALLGPAVGLLAIAFLMSRLLPRRVVYTVAAVALLVWGLRYDQVLDVADAEIFIFVVQGVILTFAAVLLLSQNQETVGAVLRRLGGARNLSTRLGLAYPLARRFRTAMTLGMYSLVVFTLVFISILSQVSTSQVDGLADSEAGNFEILANASPANPLSAADLERIDGVAGVSTLTSGGAAFAVEGREEPERWGMSGIDESFVATGPPPLDDWDRDRFATEAEVWQAVLADPELIVPDSLFLQDGSPVAVEVVRPGQTLTVIDPATGAEVERTIAGISEAGIAFTGVVASQESVGEALSQAIPNRYYLDLEEGVDAAAVAEELQGRFVTNGVEAQSFRTIAEETTEVNLQFFRLMQGYLALGLVVGIAGLGVIMVRAVRERRRQVGMLRSLGFQPSMVRSAFLLESGFVALEGIVVGTLLAIATSYQVVMNSDALGDFDVAFRVPWDQVGLLLAIALVASLVATAAPAQRASRIRPAVALRIAD